MTKQGDNAAVNRRGFFKSAGSGLAAAGLVLSSREPAAAQALSEKHKLDRIATNSWALRQLFKTRAGGGRGRGTAPGGQAPAAAQGGAPAGRGGGPARAGTGGRTAAQMKEKYGEITMLDFPQFTKDTFPGVTHMDIWSALFGDVTDDSMFVQGGTVRSVDRVGQEVARQARHEAWRRPARRSSTSRTTRRRTSPARTSRHAEGRRGDGKKWLDGCADPRRQVDAHELPEALGPSIRPAGDSARSGDGLPEERLDIVPFLNSAIESYKEMADYGGKLGIRVTIENHWGLAADPINIRIILDAVNHPYCEASPDFCNWEYEHMLVSGLKALAPYAPHERAREVLGSLDDTTTCSGRRGSCSRPATRAPSRSSTRRVPRTAIEGAKYLYKEVLAALSAPVPVI